MNLRYLSATLMTAGLLMAAPAFAQSTTMSDKQHTQEGGGPAEQCGLPWNADPAGDPNCRQHTQSVTPSPYQADAPGGRK
jgi:hypothetical protein